MSRTNTVIAAIGMNEDCSVWMERKKLRMMHYRDLISFDELNELLENYMSCTCVRKLLHENGFQIEGANLSLRKMISLEIRFHALDLAEICIS